MRSSEAECSVVIREVGISKFLVHPSLCTSSSKAEHRADNSETEEGYLPGVPIQWDGGGIGYRACLQSKRMRVQVPSVPPGSTMDDEFKKQFWKWFDNLPQKAKRSYQNSHADVAEDYFREFFYNR